MTTPGGVPNLPVGALTVDTLASQTQDMSTPAMRGRAADRVPSIFDSSTGGNMLSDLSPFGIIAQLFAGFNSHIANADPADIQGPEDLPGLLLDFIESLPVIGEMVGLLEAILGTYDGDDPALLAIQDIFTLIRNLFGGLLDFSDPGSVDPAAVWHAVVSVFLLPLNLLLGPNSLINQWQLPPTPIGRITGDLPNLVADGSFDAVPQGDPAGRWFRSASVGRTKPGALAIVGNGQADDMVNVPVAVAPGQKYRPAAWVSWTSATGSAGSLQLTLIEYADFEPVRTVVIGSATPTGTSGWVELAADYTVPPGVDMVAVAPAVTAGFTGSTAYFDDVSGPSTGLMKMSWTQNLPQLFGVTDTDLDGDIDFDDVWNSLWAGKLKRLGWLDGLLGQDWLDSDWTPSSQEWNQIRDILAGVTTVPTLPIIQDIKDWWIGQNGKTQNLSSGGLFDATKLSGVVDQTNVSGFGGATNLADALGSIVDKTVQGAGNVLGGGFGFDDLFDVFSQQQQQITDLNASVAALTAHQTGVVANSGKSVVVNFSDYSNASTPPSIFTKILDTGSGGYVSTDDGALSWVDGGNANHVLKYLYNVDVLATDYFEVSMVMPRRSENPGFSSPAYDYLLGRSNTAGTIYCDAQIGYNTLRVGCVVSGTRTWFGSAVSYATPAGALVRFRGGTTGGVRIFQILVNGSVRASFTDGGSVSQVGASYVSCGLGMEADTRGSGQTTPGTMGAWAMNDNAPAPTLGSFARVYRSNTSATSGAGTGDQLLPASTFDSTPERISPDITYDATNNKYTVSKDGTYQFEFGWHVSNSFPSAQSVEMLCWKNGAVYERDGRYWDQVAWRRFRGSFTLYLVAGDYVQPGCNFASASPTFTGDAGGTLTSMTLAKVG